MNYKDINDYEILYLVRDGDGEATESLYKKYKPFIIKKIQRWEKTGKLLGLDLSDLEQECYLAFVKAVNSYKESNNTLFYTYLCIVIDGHLSNFFKSQFSDKSKLNAITESLDTDIYNTDSLKLIDVVEDKMMDSPDLYLDYDDTAKKIKEFIYLLDMADALLIELYLSGYKNNDICKIMNEKSNNISVKISRIIKKLQKYLEYDSSLVL